MHLLVTFHPVHGFVATYLAKTAEETRRSRLGSRALAYSTDPDLSNGCTGFPLESRTSQGRCQKQLVQVGTMHLYLRN